MYIWERKEREANRKKPKREKERGQQRGKKERR